MNNPVIFSLGRYCATAFQLRRLGLPSCSGPLDWMGADDSDGLFELIGNEFEGLMDREHLAIFGQHRGCWVVRDQRYRIRTAHDFPLDPATS